MLLVILSGCLAGYALITSIILLAPAGRSATGRGYFILDHPARLLASRSSWSSC